MICKDNDFSLTEMKLIAANSYPIDNITVVSETNNNRMNIIPEIDNTYLS